MDHIYLKQLARIKFMLRREKLGTVDLERFQSDAQYARRVLETAEEANAEDLVSLAVELRHKRGLMGVASDAGEVVARQAGAVSAAPAAKRPLSAEPPAAKYMFGARG